MTHEDLGQLGQQVAAPDDPETAVLETVPNPQAGTDYVARFTAPEFTSVCPVTGQPDFAHLVIDYIPRRSLGGKQVVEALPDQFQKSRRIPRRLHHLHRQKDR